VFKFLPYSKFITLPGANICLISLLLKDQFSGGFVIINMDEDEEISRIEEQEHNFGLPF